MINKLSSVLKLFRSGLKFFFKYRVFSSQNDQMIVFGGYTSLIALFFPFRTIYAQEQNSIPGSAIRILSKLKYLDKVFLGFGQASNYFKKTNVNFLVDSGNPIRDELLGLKQKNIGDLFLEEIKKCNPKSFLEIGILVVLIVIHSIFGVGLLLFGTPSLLILGYDFANTINILMPVSICISSLQFFKSKVKDKNFIKFIYSKLQRNWVGIICFIKNSNIFIFCYVW